MMLGRVPLALGWYAPPGCTHGGKFTAIAGRGKTIDPSSSESSAHQLPRPTSTPSSTNAALTPPPQPGRTGDEPVHIQAAARLGHGAHRSRVPSLTGAIMPP
jgi:hypothetical protein